MAQRNIPERQKTFAVYQDLVPSAYPVLCSNKHPSPGSDLLPLTSLLYAF